jgi:hypothetical protein
MRPDGEAVAGEEGSRLSLQVGTRMEQATDFGCDPVASDTETVKALGRMRGTGTMERARQLLSVVGMRERERRLASASADVGRTVLEKRHAHTAGNSSVVQVRLLESSADSLLVVQAKPLEHSVDNLLAVQAKLLERSVDGLLAALAKPRDTGHDSVLEALAIQPCMDHGSVVVVVVVVQAILPCGGCSAALEALERQLEHAAGSLQAVQVNGRGYGSRVLREPAIPRGKWVAESKEVGAILRVGSKALLLPVLAMVFHGFRSMTSSWMNKASSS